MVWISLVVMLSLVKLQASNSTHTHFSLIFDLHPLHRRRGGAFDRSVCTKAISRSRWSHCHRRWFARSELQAALQTARLGHRRRRLVFLRDLPNVRV